MRKLLTNVVILILKIIGGLEMMAMLFACRVVEGRTEFDIVPAKLKPQVSDIIINDFALPDIVPEEFGGTRHSTK